jgi:hypothetical protein
LAREITLFFHFIGFGLVVSLNLAGFILNRQYRSATDIQQKAVILKAARPFGLLSPFVILIMLVTGIGNMHALGYGLLTAGWLTAKVLLFAIMATSGVMFGMIARKRGALVGQMAGGTTPANASELLAGYDRQVGLSYLVQTLLLILILSLSIIGRLGG